MPTQWTIPGSTLRIKREDACRVDGLFQSMFLTGGLTLSQVTSITGLEAYTVQNWVKRGFLTPPQRKHYDMDQVCRLLTINTFKGVLSMERVCALIGYVNGQLDSRSDDIIRDSELYFLFVKLAGRARELDDAQAFDAIIAAELADYAEPVPGAKDRVTKALRVMLIAWLAAKMRQKAESLLDEMEKEE